MADPTSPETGDAGQLEQLRRANESLRAELEETNQGVLALYAELDTQAEQLRQAEGARRRVIDVDDFAKEELELSPGRVR